MKKSDLHMTNQKAMRIRVVGFVVLLISAVFTEGLGQKFKDIYPTIEQAEDEQALPVLNAYLINDLDHPGANLLVTMIYDRRYKAADVLTEYEMAVANAQRAKLRLAKCGAIVTERDVKKNSSYYSQFGTGTDSKGRAIVAFSTVSAALVNKNDSVTSFLNKVPSIYKSFVGAVNSYDQAIKMFYQINSRYNSLDDLYLLYNDQLGDSLAMLKQAYDSTLYYLDDYKKQIVEYPINNYKQDYVVKDIDTYRLSGLITQSDFLSNNIEIWNYGQWVDDVNKLVGDDISTLRKDIITYEQNINTSLEKAAKASNFNSFEPIDRNKELLFKLKKFDNRSLLASIFQYKNRMQYLKNKTHNTSYYDTASNIDHQSKYAFYGEMVNDYYLVDSMLKEVKSRMSPINIDKHKQFIQTYYDGNIGVGEYIGKESKSIKQGFQEYIGTLREAIMDDIIADTVFTEKIVRFGKRKIPLAVSKTFSIDSIKHGALEATHLKENTDGSRYTAGVHKSTRGIKNAIAYVARISPNEKVTWYKEYDIAIDSAGSDADNFVTDMQLTSVGCAIIVRSRHLTNQSVLNSLIYIDEEGNEQLNQRLDENAYPRTINYSEKTNSFIIGFRDNDQNQVLTRESPTTLMNINVLGDLLWNVSYTFSGTLENVVNTNDGYILAGNFTAKKDKNGNAVRTKINEKQTNVYLDFVSDQGVVSNTKLITSGESFYLTDVVKVNDSNISLLGHKGIYDPAFRKSQSDKDAVYIFTNAKLKVIYSDL